MAKRELAVIVSELMAAGTMAATIGGEIADLKAAHADVKGGTFGLVVELASIGLSFEEIETKHPELLGLGTTYRSPKSAIKRAKECGVSLFNADGTAKGRTALEKEVKAKKHKGGNADTDAPGASDANDAAVQIKATSLAEAQKNVMDSVLGTVDGRRMYRNEILAAAREIAKTENATMTWRDAAPLQKAA